MDSWRRSSGRRRGRVTLPNAKMPKLPSVPRNPPGYGTTEVSLRNLGVKGAADLAQPEPAGDPPDWWEGTRPEWAVKYGLDRNQLEMDEDYFYRFNIAGIGASYYSQFDFVVPDYQIALEVQGEFWHYAQGSEKQANDEMRRNLAAGHGYQVIFLDENDVLERPEFLVEEALRGIDHSKAGFNARG